MSVYRSTALMSAGTAASRATGLIRMSAIAFALGISGTRIADAYALANTLPNQLFELLLGGVFTSVFVPVIVEARRKDGADPGPLVAVSITALAIVSLLATVLAPLVVRVYPLQIDDPVVREQTYRLASDLFRFFAPQIFFYGVGAVAEAMLTARSRFGPPKFVPVLNNLVVTAVMVVFALNFDATGLNLSPGARTLLGLGTTAGVITQAVVLLPYLRGERLNFRIDLADPAVRKVLRLSGYVLGYVLINQAGLWLVITLATGVRGGVIAYTFAFAFMQLPHGLFAVSVNTAALPTLSGAYADGDNERFREQVASSLRQILYMSIPSSVGYLLLAGPVCRLFLARGAANATDAELVAGILAAFAIGLPFFSVFQFLRVSFNTRHDTRTPLWANVAVVATHSLACFPLFALVGVRGLAYGHALSYVVGAAWLTWRLNRVCGFHFAQVGEGVLRMLLAVTPVVAAAWISSQLFSDDWMVIAVAVPAATILYLGLSGLLRLPERATLWAFVGRG